MSRLAACYVQEPANFKTNRCWFRYRTDKLYLRTHAVLLEPVNVVERNQLKDDWLEQNNSGG